MPSSVASEQRRADRRDRGQAAVELALCLPVVLLVLLGVVQVAVVVRDELLVQHAAREAARAASVAAAARPAASTAAGRVLSGARLAAVGIEVAVAGDVVRVQVSALTRTDVPLIGGLLGDVAHRATAVMTLEPP
ncbi:MAG: pilus assembly protein [Actinobacteria bacterium]|nr:pilus assembly protein [Actinomycetota bacterium]